MYTKKTEENDGKNVKKVYEVDSAYRVIYSLINSNENIDYVKVFEDADVGMKYYSGEYSLEKFIQLYPEMKYDINRVIFYYKDSSNYIDVMISDKFVIISMDDPNLELDDIVDYAEKEHHM